MGSRSLKDTLLEFRRTTLAAVPTFVLVIIATLAAAATAYAAYRVVKDVVIPAIEVHQTARQDWGTDDADGRQSKPVKYTSKAVSLTVDTTSGGEVSVTNTWYYPQFSSDGDSAGVKKLNAALKADMEHYRGMSHAWDIDTGDTAALAYNAQCTYIKNGIACIRKSVYTTQGGPQGSDEVTRGYYDLKTGEAVEPAQAYKAFGIQEKDLRDKAYQALSTYLYNNPSDQLYGDEAAQAIQGIVDDSSRYYVTDKGIFIIVQSYELGSSAWGQPEILIESFAKKDADGLQPGEAIDPQEYGDNVNG